MSKAYVNLLSRAVTAHNAVKPAFIVSGPEENGDYLDASIHLDLMQGLQACVNCSVDMSPTDAAVPSVHVSVSVPTSKGEHPFSLLGDDLAAAQTLKNALIGSIALAHGFIEQCNKAGLSIQASGELLVVCCGGTNGLPESVKGLIGRHALEEARALAGLAPAVMSGAELDARIESFAMLNSTDEEIANLKGLIEVLSDGTVSARIDKRIADLASSESDDAEVAGLVELVRELHAAQSNPERDIVGCAENGMREKAFLQVLGEVLSDKESSWSDEMVDMSSSDVVDNYLFMDVLGDDGHAAIEKLSECARALTHTFNEVGVTRQDKVKAVRKHFQNWAMLDVGIAADVVADLSERADFDWACSAGVPLKLRVAAFAQGEINQMTNEWAEIDSPRTLVAEIKRLETLVHDHKLSEAAIYYPASFQCEAEGGVRISLYELRVCSAVAHIEATEKNTGALFSTCALEIGGIERLIACMEGKGKVVADCTAGFDEALRALQGASCDI